MPKLTRMDALRGMTIWAAKSGFQEDEMGSIEVGKLGNFVILDKDIMLPSFEKTYKTKVISTYINGKKMF